MKLFSTLCSVVERYGGSRLYRDVLAGGGVDGEDEFMLLKGEFIDFKEKNAYCLLGEGNRKSKRCEGHIQGRIIWEDRK
jgi:hypothetical protein